jgi:ABC-type Fe2+-enterobactin transport system substrate-binding protein
MSKASKFPASILKGLAVAAVGLTVLAGCGSQSGAKSADSDKQSSSESQWPREFKNADGSKTEIKEKPKKIVSTSVTVTGTLLAFDAPVVASGSDAGGEFFGQWADVAKDRGVKNMWPAGKVDLEAVYGEDPDLIVVSAEGADSAKDQVDELKDVAPTIVVDYGGQTWQDLAKQLGSATGMEKEAKKAVSEFDDYVSQAAKKIDVPSGKANIVSYNGPGETNPIAMKGSAQAEVLSGLGFQIEDPDPKWRAMGGPRKDFVFANYENLTELTGDISFILSEDNKGAQKFAKDKTLANVPSVKKGEVYGLGKNSFRVDMYSATEIVDAVVDNFAK